MLLDTKVFESGREKASFEPLIEGNEFELQREDYNHYHGFYFPLHKFSKGAV